jgi:hypothetical protein
MAQFADLLRRLWLPGLAEVEAQKSLTDVRGWIAARNFQVYQPVRYPAVLTFSDRRPVCEAFAGEIVRMSMASCESVASIAPVSRLPRTRAWAVVQWYYAAFYAAHALLRMFGVGLVQIERGHVTEIRRIADVFGQPCNIEGGFHSVRVVNSTLVLTKMSGNGGSHEFLWHVFDDFLAGASSELLAARGASSDVQALALRLDDLRAILNLPPATSGSWLSYVRNRVNYRHELGVWYPYGEDTAERSAILDAAVGATPHADDVPLSVGGQAPALQSFLSACRFIVALCEDSAAEMSYRSLARRSFHQHGLLRLRNLLEQ